MSVSIYKAIENHFNSSPLLVKKCRRLYDGFAENRNKSVIPYVEFYRTNSSPEPTFGANLEESRIQFSMFSSKENIDNIKEMLAVFLHVFKDCEPYIIDTDYVCVGFQRVSCVGPSRVDGLWQVIIEYIVLLQVT